MEWDCVKYLWHGVVTAHSDELQRLDSVDGSRSAALSVVQDEIGPSEYLTPLSTLHKSLIPVSSGA